MAISPDNLERLGPRLRVVCNGDAEVNGLRAELSAAVEATPTLARQLAARERLQQAVRKPDTGRTLPTPPSRQPSTDAVKVSCFVRLAGAEATRPRLPGKTIQRGDLVTAQLSPRELETIVNRGPASGIAYIEMGEPLALPHPVVTPRHVAAPPTRAPNLAPPGPLPTVLIGIIDVGGFDFAHPDFLDEQGKTRFVRIWDQGARQGLVAGQAAAGPFGYGAELTDERMEQALDVESHARDRRHRSAPPVVQQPGAHATHVASIAAGNRGVCSARRRSRAC